MAKYIHAELIKQYGEIAQITDEPWKYTQYKDYRNIWYSCHCNPAWDVEHEYRILDPYAELKQAYEDGHTIRISDRGLSFITSKKSVNAPLWNLELSCYEILPKEPEITPFDLERAKRGDEIITRDGMEARFVGILKHREYPLLIDVFNSDGKKYGPYNYAINGTFHGNSGSSLDLFMKYPEEPKKSKTVTMYQWAFFNDAGVWEGVEGFYTDKNHMLVNNTFLNHSKLDFKRLDYTATEFPED